MQPSGRKHDRPRTYESKEEKARRDVIVKRARRRENSAAANQNIRFQVYVAQAIKVSQSPSLSAWAVS